jgi:glycosyltransferase involved in cell wall biosynthesis
MEQAMTTSTATKLPISVFLITVNEEANIARVLKSCKGMDEVLVVDSGSTDQTVEIATQHGATVVHQDWQGYAKQKAFAMSMCKNEWVLNLDADEQLTSALIDAFMAAIAAGQCDAVRCQRNDVFIGKPMSRFTKKPNNCRLYKKSKATFDPTRLVHESADINGKEISIPEYFNHYGYSTIEVITAKNNEYSSLKAQEKFNKGKKASLIKLALVFPVIFLKGYIFQRHFLSGTRGFILSVSTAHYLFIKEAKLYQLNKTAPAPMEK